MRGVALLPLLLLAPETGPPPAAPLDFGVTEETRTALAQIEVTLTGPPEALAQVRGSSFSLALGRRDVAPLLADDFCPTEGEPVSGPSATPRRPTAWILYFDGPNLTAAGRRHSIQLAREALPRILGPGDRASILSNGTRLETVQPMTSDVSLLLGALDRLEHDLSGVDTSMLTAQMDAQVARDLRLRPILPAGRKSRLIKTPSGGILGGTQPPPGGSMNYIEIESFMRSVIGNEQRAGLHDLDRLRVALARLGDPETSRALIYFAERIRRNSIAAGYRFEDLLREAAALGVRVYTVEPTPVSSSRSLLASLASQTGGKSFRNGPTTAEMVRGIVEDQECRWLLSFDPEALPRDKPVEVFLHVAVPGVHLRGPTRMEILSPARRARARLMASFATDDGTPSPLHSSLVPLAWKDGRYSALLQVTAPPTALPSATWDLGATIAATGRIEAQTSARTRVGASGVPVTLERVVELHAGTFELAAVAREVTSDRIFSLHREETWPDPDVAPVTVVPSVVLQPRAGAFTRDGKVRRTGSAVHGSDEPLDPARATALVTLVCRSKRARLPLEVSRTLVGESPIDFPALTLDLEADRCGQVRDMIPEKTLGPGRYRYQLVVKEKGAEVGRGEASFVVPEP